jgi:hypothetical protein
VEGQNPHKHHGAAMLHKLAIVVVKKKNIPTNLPWPLFFLTQKVAGQQEARYSMASI